MATVLVVDDEPDIRLLARLVLTSAGHEVVEATSGEAALALLEGADPPDAVLLDVRMPGMDGWSVLQKVRDNPAQQGLPVVIFTAHISTPAEAPPPWTDYEHFITKPFGPDELLVAVEQAISPS